MSDNEMMSAIEDLQKRVAALEEKLNAPRFYYGDKVYLNSERGVITEVKYRGDEIRYSVRVERGQSITIYEAGADDLSYAYG